MLELTFAPDASLTLAVGRGNVSMDLPGGSRGAPARNVKAQAFEATGGPGGDLEAARFDNQVEYREDAAAGRASRVARSNALRVELSGDEVTRAIFSGSVRFEEQSLRASGAEAEYDPAKDTLRLAGTDPGGGPRVADAQIEIDATAIDVTLQKRAMTARGNVRTVLRPGTSKSRLPGLLQQREPANVNANALDYDGDAGKATYTGAAALWQSETAIRGNTIALDQMRGNLVATGGARSTIALDAATSVGAADEIRYDDAARTIVYTAAAPGPVRPSGPATAGPVAASRLSGPQGDLTAARIEAFLARDDAELDRLEAQTGVTVRLNGRIATGDRLAYFADDGRYVMSGIATVPVKIVEACRETSGRTVTFFKSAERIIVDGNEEVRTQSRRGGPCPAPPAR
jgi:lipopolysaccharide export system protein LptA